MYTKRLSLILLCLFICVACDSTDLDALIEERVEELEEPPVDPSFAGEATHLTNVARAVRQQCGNESYNAVAALGWSDQLAEAAMAHSRDMAAQNYFDHTNLDGESPGVRISRAGYVAQTWGENIAAGYGSLEAVIAGWIESPGHCANIMNGRFTEFAVAVAENSNSTYGSYWTMVLATPR
ncbi:MAG: CAP domain-containing protein [Bacteroidota bacterium]